MLAPLRLGIKPGIELSTGLCTSALAPGLVRVHLQATTGASSHPAGLAWPCDTLRLPTSVPKQTRKDIEGFLEQPRAAPRGPYLVVDGLGRDVECDRPAGKRCG